MDDLAFDRDLDAVFGEHAASFSRDLRDLLRELWDEGVKQGRQAERIDGVNRHVRERPVIGIDPGRDMGTFFSTRDGQVFSTRREAERHNLLRGDVRLVTQMLAHELASERNTTTTTEAIPAPRVGLPAWDESSLTSTSSRRSSTRGK